MNKTINIVLFGIGNVGSTLIKQVLSAEEQIYKNQKISIKIPVISNSRIAFFNNDGITNSWEADFEKFSVPYKVGDIINYVLEKKLENLIAVDATASSDFVQNYIPLIQSGFHIVSANKVANTLHSDFYENLRRELKKHNRFFLYETNVGAGLPVIDTIKNLYSSGEKISKIRDVFSGSLSYVFNVFSQEEVPFSKVLRKATDLGLTEPDAREDLSGNDVARKLLILAREIGLKKEFDDINIQSLVPKNLNGKTTLAQFQQRLHELDEPFFVLKKQNNGKKVLRYVGELDVVNEKLEVKLVAEERNTAIGQLQGADSVFEIYTESYGDLPMVIRGAGAGKEVTARGVLTDIIKLSAVLSN